MLSTVLTVLRRPVLCAFLFCPVLCCPLRQIWAEVVNRTKGFVVPVFSPNVHEVCQTFESTMQPCSINAFLPVCLDHGAVTCWTTSHAVIPRGKLHVVSRARSGIGPPRILADLKQLPGWLGPQVDGYLKHCVE